MSLLGISIVIIEDADDHYYMIDKVLKEKQPDGYAIKYDTVRFTTLSESQKQLAVLTPDIVLLDLNLPDSTGKNTFEQLKHIRCPIIVSTILVDAKMGIECMKEGAQAYFVKDWILTNPLLLHIFIIYAYQNYMMRQKIKDLVKERLGEYRPLIPRCAYCPNRIYEHRYKDESTNKWYTMEEYMNLNDINFTDGICPDCFDKFFKDLKK